MTLVGDAVERQVDDEHGAERASSAHVGVQLGFDGNPSMARGRLRWIQPWVPRDWAETGARGGP